MDSYRFSDAERAVLERLSAPLGVYQYLDKRVIPLVFSEGFRRLFSYADLNEAYNDMSRDMYKDTHPDDTARISEAAWHFATEDAPYDIIYRTRKCDGDGYHVIHATGEHVYTDTGARLAYVWYMDEGAYTEDADVRGTSVSQALNKALHEKSILQAARYDYLTGLPSMTWFFELAESGRDAILREGGSPTLLYMDFSGMKYYNTRHGFAEGDRLLKGVALALENAFDIENCCHIGADRFAVFTEEKGLEEKLRRVFGKVGALNGGNSLPVRVGVYPFSVEDVPISTACDRAKNACDAIPKSDASGFMKYSNRMRTCGK
jgi:GGDEF domain-containing protein